jgi:hypothetical protein
MSAVPGRVRAVAPPAATAIALALLLMIGLPGRLAAVGGNNGVQITVTPTTVATTTGETVVTVSGTGFSTTENSGFGVYVSFGERPAAGDTQWATDANRYYNGGDGRGTIWVRPDTPSGPNQAKLSANGTFTIQLAVRASYTAANGVTYPRSGGSPLGVMTYAAHGTEVNGYSQHAFVPIVFVAAPTPPPTPRPATPHPPTPRPATPPAATPLPASARASVDPPTSGRSPDAAPSDGEPADASALAVGSAAASSQPHPPDASGASPTWRPSPTPEPSFDLGPGGGDRPGFEPGQLILAGAVGVGLLAGLAGMRWSRHRQATPGPGPEIG